MLRMCVWKIMGDCKMWFIYMPVPSECQNIASLDSFSSAVPVLLELPLHAPPGISRHLNPSLWLQHMESVGYLWSWYLGAVNSDSPRLSELSLGSAQKELSCFWVTCGSIPRVWCNSCGMQAGLCWANPSVCVQVQHWKSDFHSFGLSSVREKCGNLGAQTRMKTFLSLLLSII